MNSIAVNGFTVPVEIIHHDSNENPEESCCNRMISFMVHRRVYQYLNISFEQAIGNLTVQLSLGADNLSDGITCVITKFRESYFIDWPAVTGSRRG